MKLNKVYEILYNQGNGTLENKKRAKTAKIRPLEGA